MKSKLIIIIAMIAFIFLAGIGYTSKLAVSASTAKKSLVSFVQKAAPDVKSIKKSSITHDGNSVNITYKTTTGEVKNTNISIKDIPNDYMSALYLINKLRVMLWIMGLSIPLLGIILGFIIKLIKNI